MREMIKQEWQLSDEETFHILRKGKNGVLATVDSEGQPYCVPLDYVVVNDLVYFHGPKNGHKLDNIAQNNRVCFTVIGSAELVPNALTTKYESVVVFGNAFVVEEEELVMVMREMVNKYFPDKVEAGEKIIEQYKSQCAVVRIETTHITGKRKV